MKRLLEDSGIRLSEGGFSDAEIAAYASGLEIAGQQLSGAETAVLFEEDGEQLPYAYAALLQLDSSRYTREALTEEIKKRMRGGFGILRREELNEGFARVGSGSYSVNGSTVIFEQVNTADLKELGRFIEGYLPVFACPRCSGSGMTFDAWDGTRLCFWDHDGNGLPFSVIDTLETAG